MASGDSVSNSTLVVTAKLCTGGSAPAWAGAAGGAGQTRRVSSRAGSKAARCRQGYEERGAHLLLLPRPA